MSHFTDLLKRTEQVQTGTVIKGVIAPAGLTRWINKPHCRRLFLDHLAQFSSRCSERRLVSSSVKILLNLGLEMDDN